MVNEVNKLIFNALISGGAINLPDVGTIYVCRDSAKEIAHNRVVAPNFAVSFSSNRAAVSIVQIIESVAAIPNAQAEDIYYRWLDKVRADGVVVIEGVGKLCNKCFIDDDSFAKILNPIDDTRISVDRGRGGFIKSIVWLLLMLIVAFGGWYAFRLFTVLDAESATSIDVAINDVVEVDDDVEVDVNIENVTDNEVDKQGGEVVPLDVAESEQVADVADWRKSEAIRHWVIIGSYSTTENAERAISALESQYSELFFGYIKLGSMYAVSPFGSEKRSDCEEFTRSYKKDFAQMWIHTPKKYK